MFYSNYFATKLGIWNEKGKKNLAKFIALLGIPLEEAQQQYRFMAVTFLILEYTHFGLESLI